MPVTDILNVAKLGLLAQQGALKVVSHNISNVNTPGYSRQSARLAAQAVPNTGVPTGGDGVLVAKVRRQVDMLVERRKALGEQEMGRLEARNRYMPIVERAFNDMDGDGLGSRLEQFFTAADNLADNANNPVGRTQLALEADNLARFANSMFQTLSEVTMPVDNEITVTIDDINNRLKSLRDINLQIVAQENTNSPSLDLKDQRQQMIDELSSKLDVSSVEQPDGGMSLFTSGGRLLMDHTYIATLSRGTPLNATGFQGIHIDARTDDISANLQSGELKGLLEIRDEIIHGEPSLNSESGWLYRLNKLVGELRWQANTIHSQSVGRQMHASQQGVFELGNDLTSNVSDLDLDMNSTGYDGSPPDLNRVVSGTVTLAYGTDMDNLSIATVNIDPSSQSITSIVNALNSSDAISASIDNSNHVQVDAKDTYYGVISDTSGIMAALGIGGVFGGRNSLELVVNDELLNDYDSVSAGRIVQDTDGTYHFDSGNNMGALALGALRSMLVDPFSANEDATLAAHYGRMVGELGSVMNRDEASRVAQQSEQDFITGLRESISGVSLEEELTDLIRYQRAFQASGKMVTAADELFQSILQMV